MTEKATKLLWKQSMEGDKWQGKMIDEQMTGRWRQRWRTKDTTMADKGDDSNVTKAMMAFVGNKGDNDCEDGR